MAKPKLTDTQKKTLANLEWFIKNEIVWDGNKDLRDAVLDGHIAVFSIRGDERVLYRVAPSRNYFDTLVMTDTKENAKLIMKYNLTTKSIMVDMLRLYTMEEMCRSFVPDLFRYGVRNEI